MADVKTNLRDLSVAIFLGLLKRNNGCVEKNKLYNPRFFFETVNNVISNDISAAENLRLDNFGSEFKQDYKSIIDNGFKLAKKIFDTPFFEISKDDKIEWLGFQTQKGNPKDLDSKGHPKV